MSSLGTPLGQTAATLSVPEFLVRARRTALTGAAAIVAGNERSGTGRFSSNEGCCKSSQHEDRGEDLHFFILVVIKKSEGYSLTCEGRERVRVV